MKKSILKYMDEISEDINKISDSIWDLAELKFNEAESSNIIMGFLEKNGFQIERNVAGLKTSFVASFGEGSPVIGILGEYDALSGMNQAGGITHKEEDKKRSNGHGCGHHLLGAGSMAAAAAVKRYLEKSGRRGTIKYFGCPGEEGGSGKAIMVKEGVFEGIDAAVTWHPSAYNAVMSSPTLANYQVAFKFSGITSHAGASPHLGRSALDAVELMNVGVNYLREHVIQEARIHYAVTNTGGVSPNVVQGEAEVLYLIRAPKTPQVDEIYKRIIKIARGAALMTETEVEIRFDKGCSNFIPNKTLDKVLYDNLNDIILPTYTSDEKKYADEIKATLSRQDLENDLEWILKYSEDNKEEISKHVKEDSISNRILPYKYSAFLLKGSTDVGDVSWVVPTSQIFTSSYAIGTPFHSWQMVTQGRSSIAHKGSLIAGKVLAGSVIDLINNNVLIDQAKADLTESLNGDEYISPMLG